MLGEKRVREIANLILSSSTADQTEVVILADDEALTRFANSAIHQNVAQTDAEVRIRVVLRDSGPTAGARVGVAATNNLAEEALTRTLENGIAIARLQPVNPDFRSLPGPQPLPDVSAFSEATAGCTPEQRAKAVSAICLMARDAGVVASGALTTTIAEVAVANSLGVFGYYPTTYADFNTVIMSDTSAGYASALALDVDGMDFEASGREALEKCLHSQNPQALAPGEYTVILEPYAVQDILNMMSFSGFGAVALQEGRSFMSGRLGQQIVDRRVSIWDDGLSTDGLPWPFDFEGVPRQRVDLIDHGVARGVVYDSYRAGKEEGKRSTGHAMPAPNGMGPMALNVFMATGDASHDDMISSTERGLYVTRFHYTRVAEPRSLVVTGMTRDGTFLIENGEMAHPVKNLRFTQSYIEALNHVEMIGEEARLLSGFGGMVRDSAPALKLGLFAFTGATEF